MKTSRLLMIAGALLLLSLFKLPLWNITLEAPQYPTPLGMNIHINKITDVKPNDVKNINLLNHYIGMQEIPEHLKEFDMFPYIVIAMVVLGVLIGLRAGYKWFLAWFVLMAVLGLAGIYDFYLWEYNYGHNLNPKAILKFTDAQGHPMAYQPPLFGTKKILNFTAHSYPRAGAYLMFLGMFLALVAFFVGKKEKR